MPTTPTAKVLLQPLALDPPPLPFPVPLYPAPTRQSGGHVAIPGDIFGCHTCGGAAGMWWVDTRDTGSQPTMHRVVSLETHLLAAHVTVLTSLHAGTGVSGRNPGVFPLAEWLLVPLC